MSKLLCTVKQGRGVGGLVAAVNQVSMDEPCMCLTEQNIQSPGSRGFRRYRTITVIRQDASATYMHDMGPAETWMGCEQFRIPGGVQDDRTGRFEIVHTVGELCDIADYLRAGFFRAPDQEPADLWQAAIEQAEEQILRLRHATSCGPAVTIQRS